MKASGKLHCLSVPRISGRECLLQQRSIWVVTIRALQITWEDSTKNHQDDPLHSPSKARRHNKTPCHLGSNTVEGSSLYADKNLRGATKRMSACLIKSCQSLLFHQKSYNTPFRDLLNQSTQRTRSRVWRTVPACRNIFYQPGILPSPFNLISTSENMSEGV